MDSVADIIASLGGTVEAAKRLDLPPSTVSAWKSRHSIPATYWLKIINESAGGISYEDLERAVAAFGERDSCPTPIKAAE